MTQKQIVGVLLIVIPLIGLLSLAFYYDSEVGIALSSMLIAGISIGSGFAIFGLKEKS